MNKNIPADLLDMNKYIWKCMAERLKTNKCACMSETLNLGLHPAQPEAWETQTSESTGR